MRRLRFPHLLVAAAAFVAAAIVLASCAGSSDDKSNEREAGTDPETILSEATLQGVESGKLDFTLESQIHGSERGLIKVKLVGPFKSEGDAGPPQLDMTAKLSGELGGNIKFESGLTLLPDSAYVNYEGTEYEVDPAAFAFLGSALSPSCQEELSHLTLADFFREVVPLGRVEVDGESTTEIGGSIDMKGIGELVDAIESPACASQLGAAGLLPSKAEIRKVLFASSHIVVFVGDDGIVREIAAQFGGYPEPAKIIKDEIEFDLKLTELNEEPEISAPANAKPLGDILKLDVKPLELLGPLEGEGGGLEGLGNLLTGLSGGGATGNGGNTKQAYLECLGEASTADELQRCSPSRH